MKVTIHVAPSHEVVSKVRAVVEILGVEFRAPHYTCGPEALAEELALAAGGILLLDEAADFSRSSLDALRVAISDVVISGAELPIAIVLSIEGETDRERLSRRFRIL